MKPLWPLKKNCWSPLKKRTAGSLPALHGRAGMPAHPVTMKEKWQQLEQWLEQNAPALLQNLNPPATEADIAQTEAAMQMQLPPSVRQSYLIHNGETPSSWGLFVARRFLPLNEMLDWLKEMQAIEDEYQFGDFDTGRMIPIFHENGNLLYVEHRTDGGESEVIEWWHEDPMREVKGRKLGRLFRRAVESIGARGRYLRPRF